jgi:tetratricopeptide (TPR) repeat protein
MLKVLLAIAILFTPVLGDEGHHHEDLTAAQLGSVEFPTSCAAPVQQRFERGIALLHSFWYEEAEKEFLQITNDDPHCAMAHWGVAMSLWHQLWNRPDEATQKRGREELEKAASLRPSAREQAYIAALQMFYGGKGDFDARSGAYCKAMEQLYAKFPGDREAAAFYALSLLASAPEDDPTFTNNRKAGAILEKLFAQEPDHPGVAHYLIHSYDNPQLAPLALAAARRYAKIAPAAPHALHMPSHIFARLGLWQDDIDSNLASIAATRKTAAMHMGGESHQFHAMDYLVYAYLQSGREAEAWKVIEEVRAMPAVHDMQDMGYDAKGYALSQFPATYQIELRHWKEAATLEPVSTPDEANHAITSWARAVGAARSGNLEQARQDIADIERIHKIYLDKHRPFTASMIDDSRKQAAAWLAHAEGKDDEAIRLLKECAEEEDKLALEPSVVPAREQLADMLLEMNRPQQALAEYETDLKLNPNRFNGLYGAARAAEAAGRKDLQASYYEQLLKVCAGSVSNRPELARARQEAETIGHTFPPQTRQ